MIVAAPTPSAVAAKAAASTIPIVFEIASDPVAVGLVASLNAPSGNLTGVVGLNVEVGPKRLELMHELVPAATVIAALVNPSSPAVADVFSKDLQAAAHARGLQVHMLRVTPNSTSMRPSQARRNCV